MNEEKHAYITVCLFKRKRRSKTERGILIDNAGYTKIVDRNTKIVEPTVWSFTPLWTEGTLPVIL